MTEQERQRILSRLASTDVVSLKQADIKTNSFQGSLDELEIALKLSKKFRIPLTQVDPLRNAMINHLQNSDLTVNFKADQLFANKLRGGLLNTFERPGHSSGGYLEDRESSEENLFGYSRSNGRTSDRQSIYDRLKQFGSRNSIDFAPSMRPKYGALNYTNYPYGSATLYGKSHMVLKEHVKHNCTFTGVDSMNYKQDSSGGVKAATFINMERIIANLADKTLEGLGEMVNNPNQQKKPQGYIEAQIHGEIKFSRDVAKIYIDNIEASTNPNLRKHIDSFSRKYRIPVQYYTYH